MLKIKKFEVDKKILKSALEISSYYGVALYDSIFLAVAEKENCLLITADYKFVRKVKKNESRVCLLENCEENFIFRNFNFK